MSISDRANNVQSRSGERGYTLLELLVVLAILAILALITVPAYRRYIHRVHRVDGQELLLRIAAAQERYYAGHDRYGTLEDMGYGDRALSERGYYSLDMTVSADPSGNSSQVFIARAVALGDQAGDVCGDLSLDNAGRKAPADASALSAGNGSCW